MAEFVHPHNQMNADRPYTTSELIRALRKDLAAEEEAVSVYAAQAEMSNDKFVKKALLDIADEERVHVGELQELINRLDKNEKKLIEKGIKEVGEMSPKDIANDMESKGETTEEIRRISQFI